MASFAVFEHVKYAEDSRAERAIFVRDGFSFAAFLFGPFWLAFHGMIVLLAAYIVFGGTLGAAVFVAVGEESSGIVTLLFMLWFGFEARALRRWALTSRAWTMTAVVEADSQLDAERRYFANRPARPDFSAAEPSAAPAPWGARPADDAPPLGVFPEGQR